jgi:anti-sigma factor (TIGR02949 family)
MGETDCNETLRELEAFLDHELSEDVHVAIHAHLAGCHHCHETFDFHAELKAVVARKCQEELPPGLLERIRQCFGDDAGGAADDQRSDA